MRLLRNLFGKHWPPQAGNFFAGVIKVADLWQNNDPASGFLGQNCVPPYINEFFLHFSKEVENSFWAQKKGCPF